MAEGWARHLKGGILDVYSAGIVKHGLNPSAVQVMAEAEVDISGQYSKTIEELPIQHFDWVITLCGHARETCPLFPGRTVLHGFDDPPQLASAGADAEEQLAPYRRVRDEIRDFVLSLPESLH